MILYNYIDRHAGTPNKPTTTDTIGLDYQLTFVILCLGSDRCLKKNLNSPRPSEHPPVRGKKCQNV